MQSAHRSRQRGTGFSLSMLPAPSCRQAVCTMAGSRLAIVPAHAFQIRSASARAAQEGLCSAAEYTGADGGLKQQAAPCGTLTLKQFKQEASLAGAHRSRQRVTCFILSMLPAPSGRRAACTIAGSRLASVPTLACQIGSASARAASA